MIRTQRFTIATPVGQPTVEVYSFQTGDVEVWVQGSETANRAFLTDNEVYATEDNGFELSLTPFHSKVGPGDVLRVGYAGTGTATVRVTVRSVEA